MNDELKTKLLDLGFTQDQVQNLADEGVNTEADMALLSADDIKSVTKCGLIYARKAAQAFSPVPAPAAATAGSTSGGDEIPEGKNPTTSQINNYAEQMGMDPSMLTMLMFGNMAAGSGLDMDLSGIVPVPQVVGGYNPKIRNMPFMIMGQIENRLGTPIVVINADGSVNPDLTVKYIMSLEEGFDPTPDNVYYDEESAPYEVIRVGVDAQGIYDADPVNSSRALQKNGMGVGRINWHNVPIEVRQVVYFAASQTRELNPSDDTAMARLRDKIGPTTTRLDLRGDFPKAIAAYNEALRTGSLPTLRVQLARSPRRRENMPRRRQMQTRDLSGYPKDPALVRGDDPYDVER
jgi:hypothetical protein